jgi:hypothetical protein
MRTSLAAWDRAVDLLDRHDFRPAETMNAHSLHDKTPLMLGFVVLHTETAPQSDCSQAPGRQGTTGLVIGFALLRTGGILYPPKIKPMEWSALHTTGVTHVFESTCLERRSEVLGFFRGIIHRQIDRTHYRGVQAVRRRNREPAGRFDLPMAGYPQKGPQGRYLAGRHADLARTTRKYL